jgi:hypothetical protein
MTVMSRLEAAEAKEGMIDGTTPLDLTDFISQAVGASDLLNDHLRI